MVGLLCLSGGKSEAHASLKYIEAPDRRSVLDHGRPMDDQTPQQGWEVVLIVWGYLPLVWGAKIIRVLDVD